MSRHSNQHNNARLRGKRLDGDTHKTAHTESPMIIVHEKTAKGKHRQARISRDLLWRKARLLRIALDPKSESPGAVKTLADMTPEERAALEERYGAKIK